MLERWWKSFVSWREGIFAQFAETIVTISAGILIVAVLMGITGVALFFSNRAPDCLEDFVILDPLPSAAVFLKQLDESELIDVDKTSEYGWLYIDREIRMTIVIDNVQWSGVPCYLSDSVIFLNVESFPIETGA